MTPRRNFLHSSGVARFAKVATPVVGVIAITLLYLPIIGLGVLSFSERPLSGIPWPVTLEWYERLLGSAQKPWLAPTLTSIGIGLIVSFLSTTVAVAIARAMPFIKRRASILACYLAVLVMPGLLVGVAVLITYRMLFKLPTGLWSVVFVHFIWALPFSLLCMMIVILRFDHRLLEAARDLGATRWRQFVDIELPLLKPGISASAFFGFLLSFNELPRTSYVRGSVNTLPYYIWTESSAHATSIPLVYALSAMIMAGSFLLCIAALHLLNRDPR